MSARAILFAAACLVAAPAAADPFVVCDNGLRCVRAPCPSTNVLDLSSGSVLRVSGVDLARLDPREREKAERESAISHGSLVLDGAVVDTMMNDAGKARPAPIFVATKIVRGSTKTERQQCRAQTNKRN